MSYESFSLLQLLLCPVYTLRGFSWESPQGHPLKTLPLPVSITVRKRPLWCQSLSDTPGHPTAALCCGDPAALGLWVRSPHCAPADHGCWSRSGITLSRGLGSCRLVPLNGKRGHSPIVTISVLTLLHLCYWCCKVLGGPRFSRWRLVVFSLYL